MYNISPPILGHLCRLAWPLLVTLLFTVNLGATTGPPLLGHWTFEPGHEKKDLQGNFPDLDLLGATIKDGFLDVGVNAYARVQGYTGPSIVEKTLVAWVKLDDIELRGGSILTIDKLDLDIYDGIVYGEHDPYRWMAGSELLTRYFGGYNQPEETKAGKLVQLAISYETILGLKKIKIYRDGELVSSSTVLSFPSFSGSATEILFGLRHTLASGVLPLQPWVDAKIEEARIYGGILTGVDLKNLVCFKVPPVSVGITLEAECALVGANFLVQADGLTVDGKVVLFPGTRSTSAPPADLAENRIRFSVDVAAAGTYHLFARARAANSSFDSFWVRVNGGAWTSWNAWGTYGVFAWFEVNAALGLKQGTNVIDFAYREEQALLDKIVLSLDATLPIGLGGIDLTCGQTPANQSPVAVAKADVTVGTAPLTVNLDASASRDPDGTLAAYRWTYTGGGTATGVKPTVTLSTPGTYTFTLTVTDNDGATATDRVSVEVKAEVVVDPPTDDDDDITLEAECALVGANFLVQADGLTVDGKVVLFAGTRSTSAPPADLAENRIRFSVADVQAGTYHLFARARAANSSFDSFWVRVNGGAWTSWNAWGTYGTFAWFEVDASVSLKAGVNVIDFAYREDNALLDKIVLSLDATLPIGLGGIDLTCGQAPANRSPVAVAKADVTVGTAPLTVNLDASASRDPDGTIAAYRWTYTGGGTATGVKPTVTLSTPGTYTFTLTVTDNDGATATDRVSVEVKAEVVVDPPTDDDDDITLEAECALVGANFLIQADGLTVDGKVVLFPGTRSTSAPPADLAENRIRFSVDVAAAGTYHLFARARAANSSFDSFWVRVNGGAWTSWNAWGTYGTFAWFEVNAALSLKQGTNVIDFAYREEQALLDKIVLSLDATLPIGLGGIDLTCGQAPANRSPVAVAKANVTVGTAPLTVNLDASASRDPDGTIAAYRWTYTGGGTATGVKPTVTLSTPGTYTFTLTVTDNDGATATDRVSVEVKAEVVVDPPTDDDDDITLEAECALVGANFLIQADGLTVDGKVVLFPGTRSTSAPPADLAENRIRFSVDVAAAGAYHLFARARADNNSYDSYWVRVNGGEWVSWNSWGTYGVFAWFEVDASVSLKAGVNVIDFAYREDNALLDKIVLSLDATLPIGLGGIDLTCGQAPVDQDCAPLITQVSLSTQFVLLNAQVRVDVGFSDEYDRDDHLVEVAWGDGKTSILTIDQLKNQAFGLHAYLSVGLFDITVRLLDGCGGVVVNLFDYQVMCTDRPETWVDGRGSYASSRGALLNNLLLFGDAQYDFVGKYETNGSLSGFFNLDLDWCNKYFRSTSVDYLHIDGDVGKMKGKGKINGTGNYTYLITFEDNLSLLGVIGFDKMRVQLWDEDRDHFLIYDSNIGASIFGYVCTDISLGHVTIHSPGTFLNGALGAAVMNSDAVQVDEVAVEVYPNPAVDRVNLSIHGFSQESSVRMMDQTGRLILTQRLAAGQEQLELDFAQRDLAPGVYLITVSSADQTVSKRLSIVK